MYNYNGAELRGGNHGHVHIAMKVNKYKRRSQESFSKEMIFEPSSGQVESVKTKRRNGILDQCCPIEI